MSELDANITSNLRQYATDAKFDDEVRAAARAVEHIKQAFMDAGWANTRNVEFQGFAVKNIMTGQEWYDRFEKELDKYVTENYMDAIYPHEALKAAKKASGLSDHLPKQ